MFVLSGIAQPPPGIQWESNFGGSGKEEAFVVRPTLDGGYVVAGTTESNDGDISLNDGGRDVWVVKLDAQGNLIWENTYGGSLADYAYDIRQTNDGGYIVVGETFSSDGDVAQNNGGTDLWVFKLDPFGNLAWEKTYGGSISDRGIAIRQIAGGGYIVAGATSSDNGDIGYNHGNDDAWVIKLDAFGNLVWEQTYGGSVSEGVADIQQIPGGGYIVGGYSNSSNGDLSQNKGLGDAWMFKISGTGSLVWSKSFGGSDHDIFGASMYMTDSNNDALLQTSDGGYIAIGRTQSNDGDIGSFHGYIDIWIVKLDANGNLVWEKTYGGSDMDAGSAIVETPDGNFVVAAGTRSTNGDVGLNHGGTDYWVFKIDALGNILWEQTYGGTGHEYLTSLQQVSGCEFILAGYSESNDGDVGGNQGMSDFWVVKLQTQWPPPTVASPQSFCWSENATLADLGVTGNSAPTGSTPVFTWYDDSLKTNILPGTTVVADGENYYVSQTIDGCESPLTEVLVNVDDPMPTAGSPQSFCEDDNPTLAELVVGGQNLNWYGDVSGNVPIPTTTGLQDGFTYYVSQTLDNCESSLLPITVEVSPPPAAFPLANVVACDTDADGGGEFHLPDLNQAVTGGAANTTVTYHASFSDAEYATGILPDQYIVQNSPKNIYARVFDTLTGCDSIVKIVLLVAPLPEIAALEDLTGCNEGNGQAIFDLTQNNDNILGGQDAQNLIISYHTSQADADSGQNAIPNPNDLQSGPRAIFVRLENGQTGCFDTGAFNINVAPRPNIATIPIQEEFCSDLPGGNFATLDLTLYDNQINPGNPANTQVVYYENLNAYNANSPIPNPNNYTTLTNPQLLIAETVDTGTGCPSSAFVEIEIRINDRPVVDISPYNGRAICWDSNAATPVEGGNYQALIIETGLDENEYDFSWTLNGSPLAEMGPSLQVNEPGEYRVTVTDTDGNTTTCTGSSMANIIEANPPEFNLSRTSGFVASEHGILVHNVTGAGSFEFRLDQGGWVPLTNGGTLLFEGIAPGTHVVYGRSLEGCGTTVKTITLIGYPKFFTPNNDGHNDTWNIIGLEEGKLYIFDRYGKLLASPNLYGTGWDGNYNGRRMPSDDYWFKVEFVEKLPDGSERPGEFMANFSLIR